MTAVPVTRSQVRLSPDPRRLITKPYMPEDHGPVDGGTRVGGVIARVLGLSPDEAREALRDLRTAFSARHADLDDLLTRAFWAVAHSVPDAADLPDELRRLIGSYFVHEYSIEGAALTNPSIVPAPDQGGVKEGSLRIIVSVRAIGEGHISSIEFRTGLLGSGGDVTLEAAGPAMTGERLSPSFDKALFTAKLDEMGVGDDLVRQALGGLEDRFTMAALEGTLADLARQEPSSNTVQHVVQMMHWLASSNYELSFPQESEISQRVMFPSAPAESHGMEDARMVRFTDLDGSATYYTTYTAYDGSSILPQLIETADFRSFRIATLNGPAARNKGIAIFPRRIAGRFAALARFDGESNYFMTSDHVRFWHDAERIQIPARSWELMQIGNAGGPLETEAGWLVVTHGVGPMRRYALGAILLDIDDPRRVIGRLDQPLMVPDQSERDGYVPNVVYSCGSLIHQGRLVIAYGASDTAAGFATVEVDALLTELTRR